MTNEQIATIIDALRQYVRIGELNGSTRDRAIALRTEAAETAQRLRAAPRTPAEGEPVICSGCGSTWTDEQLRAEKAKNPKLRSCCPERKPLNIREWMAKAEAAEQRSRATWQDLQKLWEAIAGGPEPRCRDCADHNGRCQDKGPPCDPQERALERVAKLRAQVENAWQQMSSAPRDGTHFWAYQDGKHYECWWHDDWPRGGYWMDHGDTEPEPEVWRYLPLLPAPKHSSTMREGE